MSQKLRVLILEDSEDDVLLLVRELDRAGFELSHQVADTAAATVDALDRQPWDAILSDFHMGRFTALDALELVRARQLDTPFILISGAVGETLAAEVMRAGAHDYLMKDNLARLGPALQRELTEAAIRKDQRQDDRALRQQALLMDEVSDAVISTDLDFVVQTWNRAAERIYGYEIQEVIGRPLAELVRTEYPGDSRDVVLREFMDHGHYQGEFIQHDKDGAPLTILGSVTMLRDEHGAPVGAVAVNRDLTDHRGVEARAQELGSIVEQMPDGIICTDTDNRITYVNRAAEELFGWTQAELLGELPDCLNAGPLVDDVQRTIYARVSSGEIYDGEAPNRRKDGSTFICQFRVAPIFDRDGSITAYMGAQRDVTRQRRRETQLAQADRMVSVGMLAAGVAHEINNPLTYVLYNLQCIGEELPGLTGALTRLQRALGPGKVEEVLGGAPIGIGQLGEMVSQISAAADGAERIRDIVKDLRTFSHVDELRLVPVSLNDAIESAINMAQNEIKYRARLVKRYGALPTILANDGKLAQVFLNLIVNAAQAIDEGEVEQNTIRVRTWLEGAQVVAEIKDTGRGIPDVDMVRLFEPFFTTKEVGAGSGLGLSICHDIITGLGGEIDVESQVGQGTRFEVRLPVVAAPASQEPLAEASAAKSMIRGRFLIVDDERLIGEAMSKMLAREHDAVVVDSGARAREVLQDDQSFDGIICDLMMPDVTGMDLHGWLEREHPALAQRMIFVTGGAFTPLAREFLARVSNPRLDKPLDPVRLQGWIRARVDARRGGGT